MCVFFIHVWWVCFCFHFQVRNATSRVILCSEQTVCWEAPSWFAQQTFNVEEVYSCWKSAWNIRRGWCLPEFPCEFICWHLGKLCSNELWINVGPSPRAWLYVSYRHVARLQRHQCLHFFLLLFCSDQHRQNIHGYNGWKLCAPPKDCIPCTQDDERSEIWPNPDVGKSIHLKIWESNFSTILLAFSLFFFSFLFSSSSLSSATRMRTKKLLTVLRNYFVSSLSLASSLVT